VAIGSNIVSLMQHRARLAVDSIPSSKHLSLATFTKFLATYENYRKEGGRAKSIVSAGMWPTSMQDKAWSGLRDTDFSMISNVVLDDELLIGYWRWSVVNKVSELKKVLDVTPQGKLKKGNLEECVNSVSAAYNLIDHYQTLRRWLYIVIETYELYTLDMYLAASMLAKFGWWDVMEERERGLVRVMRTKKTSSYDWALDSLRQEMKLLEDVTKALSRGSSTRPVVGMGFSGGSTGGSKSQERGRFGQAICFSCGATGHISSRCRVNPKDISKEIKIRSKKLLVLPCCLLSMASVFTPKPSICSIFVKYPSGCTTNTLTTLYLKMACTNRLHKTKDITH
jgi:hypothetical protein